MRRKCKMLHINEIPKHIEIGFGLTFGKCLTQ